jgi:hypothetical protein
LLLLENVAFSKIDRYLYSLNVLPHSGCLLVLGISLAHFSDQCLYAGYSRIHDLFELPYQLLERGLGFGDELFIGWHTEVALDMIFLLCELSDLLISVSNIFKKFLNELAQKLFISSALHRGDLTLQNTNTVLP